MQTDYSGDPPKDPDVVIRDAASERSGKPIRLRIQPQVLRADATRGGQYQFWKDVRWTVECDTADEVFAFRDALRTFFTALGRSGPEGVTHALAAAGRAGKEAVA